MNCYRCGAFVMIPSHAGMPSLAYCEACLATFSATCPSWAVAKIPQVPTAKRGDICYSASENATYEHDGQQWVKREANPWERTS